MATELLIRLGLWPGFQLYTDKSPSSVSDSNRSVHASLAIGPFQRIGRINEKRNSQSNCTCLLTSVVGSRFDEFPVHRLQSST